MGDEYELVTDYAPSNEEASTPSPEPSQEALAPIEESEYELVEGYKPKEDTYSTASTDGTSGSPMNREFSQYQDDPKKYVEEYKKKQEAKAKMSDASRLTGTYTNLFTNLTHDKKELGEVNKEIVDIMQANGHTSVQLDGNKVMWTNPETGKYEAMSGGMFNDLISAKYEVIGGVTGAIAGARTGLMATKNPWGALAGSVIGGAAGAAGGKAGDMYSTALDMGIDMSKLPWLEQTAAAGATDVVFGLAGSAVAKIGGKAFDSIKGFLKDGNVDKALEYIGAINPKYSLVDGQPPKELVNNTINYLKGYGEEGQKVIDAGQNSEAFKRAMVEASVITDPSYSTIIKELATEDTTAVRLSDTVQQRKDVTKATMNNGKNVTKGQNVVDNLVESDEMTQSLYGKSKATVINSFRNSTIDNRVTEGVQQGTADFVNSKLADPMYSATLQKDKLTGLFKNTMKLGEEVQDIQGLLNLRDSFDYLMKKGNLSNDPMAINYLQKVDNAIDFSINNNGLLSAVEKKQVGEGLYASREMVDETAKSMTSKLMAAVNGESGKNSDKILDDFIKYGKSDDGVYEKVVGTLSAEERTQLENSMVKRLTEKHLSDTTTDYVKLSEELQAIGAKVQSPEAKQSIEIASRMSDTFSNDANIAKMTSEMRRGSGNTKQDDFLTTSGSGMGKTVGGKLATSLATNRYKLLMNTGNKVMRGLMNLPGIKGAVKLVGGKQMLESMELTRNKLHTIGILEDSLNKNPKDFVGFLADIANKEGIPDEVKLGIKDYVRLYDKVQDDLKGAGEQTGGTGMPPGETPPSGGGFNEPRPDGSGGPGGGQATPEDPLGGGIPRPVPEEAPAENVPTMNSGIGASAKKQADYEAKRAKAKAKDDEAMMKSEEKAKSAFDKESEKMADEASATVKANEKTMADTDKIVADNKAKADKEVQDLKEDMSKERKDMKKESESRANDKRHRDFKKDNKMSASEKAEYEDLKRYAKKDEGTKDYKKSKEDLDEFMEKVEEATLDKNKEELNAFFEAEGKKSKESVFTTPPTKKKSNKPAPTPRPPTRTQKDIKESGNEADIEIGKSTDELKSETENELQQNIQMQKDIENNQAEAAQEAHYKTLDEAEGLTKDLQSGFEKAKAKADAAVAPKKKVRPTKEESKAATMDTIKNAKVEKEYAEYDKTRDYDTFPDFIVGNGKETKDSKWLDVGERYLDKHPKKDQINNVRLRKWLDGDGSIEPRMKSKPLDPSKPKGGTMGDKIPKGYDSTIYNMVRSPRKGSDRPRAKKTIKQLDELQAKYGNGLVQDALDYMDEQATKGMADFMTKTTTKNKMAKIDKNR